MRSFHALRAHTRSPPASERQRLANIAENEALLRELGVAGGLSGRASKQRATTAEKPKKAAVTKKRKAPARAPEPAGPRRVSSRLAGLEADSEKLQRKYEVSVGRS